MTKREWDQALDGDEPADEPERFVCSGCGDEMSENDFLTFNEMCRGCERERAEEEAADARAER